ncbi:MAG: hypothetical protein NTV01_01960 [Bacteroidia bacterium]|nr:hypothetical protein [Bacteroidia bacterium]
MKAISSFLYGFSAAWKSLRMIMLIYLSYLVIALLLAIPFYGLFRSLAGNSQLPDSLMNGFDATAIRELLNNGGKLFGFYLKGFLPWILAFLLFQVYLNGGIFSWVSNPRGKFSISLFHVHGRKYFWRYLKLIIYFLVIHLIIGLILYIPYGLTTGSQVGLTDQQVMRPLFFLMGGHLILLVYIFLLADLVKSRLFEQDTRKVLKTIFKCLKMSLKRLFSFYFLGLLLLALPLALFAGFYLVRSSIIDNATGIILFVFVIQQVIIFLRIFLRVWRLATTYVYHLKISPGSN